MTDAPARYPSTSLRWVLASLVAVLGLSVTVILVLGARIDAYEAGYAAATPGATATVVSSSHFRKGPDDVQVQWRGTDGATHQHTFDVDDARNFPVGATIPVRLSATTPDQNRTPNRTRYTDRTTGSPASAS